MKFSIALASIATILSVTTAVPVDLARRGAHVARDPVNLERRGVNVRRGALTRDEHDVS